MKLDSIIQNIQTLAEDKDVYLVMQSLNGSLINYAELDKEGQKVINALKSSEIRISSDKSISNENYGVKSTKMESPLFLSILKFE